MSSPTDLISDDQICTIEELDDLDMDDQITGASDADDAEMSNNDDVQGRSNRDKTRRVQAKNTSTSSTHFSGLRAIALDLVHICNEFMARGSQRKGMLEPPTALECHLISSYYPVDAFKNASNGFLEPSTALKIQDKDRAVDSQAKNTSTSSTHPFGFRPIALDLVHICNEFSIRGSERKGMLEPPTEAQCRHIASYHPVDAFKNASDGFTDSNETPAGSLER